MGVLTTGPGVTPTGKVTEVGSTRTTCFPTTRIYACRSCRTGRSWGWGSLLSVLGIIGGGITIPGRFIGNAMSGYEGRRRRVGRRTGAHGRRIIGRGRGRNRDDRITVVEDPGRSRGDLTMARALGHNLVGRIVVGDFDL